MDRYEKIEKNGSLGEGTYGVVYKAKDLQTGNIVALKVSVTSNASTVHLFALSHRILCSVFALRWRMKAFPAQHFAKSRYCVSLTTQILSSEYA